MDFQILDTVRVVDMKSRYFGCEGVIIQDPHVAELYGGDVVMVEYINRKGKGMFSITQLTKI